MKIYTLGTSHGAAEPGRACSGNLLTIGESSYLFDCGGNVEEKMVNLNLPIQNIKSVFITHMHEDHVANLSAIAKHFTFYIRTKACVQMYFPEQEGINAFKNWIAALHTPSIDERLFFKLVQPGKIYSDENITVTAIPTAHIENGLFPSYAYLVESDTKTFLYTGDLAGDFHDYPEIVFEKEFDAILCELVHFDVEKHIDRISKSKTKQMIFTHLMPCNAEKIKKAENKFPFPVSVAEDGASYIL